METKANYVLIGAFTIAGFLGLLAFMIWFAKLELNKQFAYYDIYFPEVSGLGISSEVGFAGLMVGKVIDMQIADGTNAAVRVRIEVQEDTPVRTNSLASLELSAVTGSATMAISAGTPDAPLLREAHPDDIPVIEANRSVLQTLYDQGPEMISRLNTVAEQMTQLLGPDNQTRVHNILSNAERSTANLDKAMADISKATDAIASAADDISAFGGKLDSLGAAAETTLANADTAMAQFNETAKRADLALEAGTATLDQARSYIAGDLQGLTQQLQTTAASVQADLTRLTDQAVPMMGSAGRAFEGADRIINTEVGPVAADLRVTLGRLNDTLASVTADLPDITARLRSAAESADGAFASLRVMLDGARAPVQAFARDGLPQFTRMASDLRALVTNVDKLVTTLRRNPAQIITGPKTPEFRR